MHPTVYGYLWNEISVRLFMLQWNRSPPNEGLNRKTSMIRTKVLVPTVVTNALLISERGKPQCGTKKGPKNLVLKCGLYRGFTVPCGTIEYYNWMTLSCTMYRGPFLVTSCAQYLKSCPFSLTLPVGFFP